MVPEKSRSNTLAGKKLPLSSQKTMIGIEPMTPLISDKDGSPKKGEGKKVEFSDPLVLEHKIEPIIEEKPKPELDSKKTMAFIESQWKKWFVKGMKDYVRVPVSTPKVDPDFCLNQMIDTAIECVDIYAEKIGIDRLTREIVWLKEDKFSSPPLIVYQVGRELKTDVEAKEKAENDLEAKVLKREDEKKNGTEFVQAELQKAQDAKKSAASKKKKKKKGKKKGEDGKSEFEDTLKSGFEKKIMDEMNRKKRLLFYCRIDKRPQTTESFEKSDPYRPKLSEDWFYGKGVGDAGYGIFMLLLAIKNLQE